MSLLLRLVRDTRASSAAEFGLTLPLLLILLLGIVDAGRFMWDYNEAEKATQMGVRFAVVTDMVPAGLSAYSFSISDGVPQGEPIPTDNFEYAVCNDADCSDCAGSVCGSTGYNATAFNGIVARMAAINPRITPANVEVEYRNVGQGFAGNPDGPDVSALVTVRLKDLTFRPVTCFVFDCTMTMPSFSSALTLEDASGSVSN